MRWIQWFAEVAIEDVALVGGKNASLGEMRRALTRRAFPFRMATRPPQTPSVSSGAQMRNATISGAPI